MRPPLLVSVLVGAVSGLVAATAVFLFVSPGAEPVDSTVNGAAADTRVQALERENARLAERIDQLERRTPTIVRGAVDAPSREEFAALEAAVEQLKQEQPLEASPGVDAAVEYALEQRQLAERAAEEQRAEQARARRVERQVERWTKELELSEYQAEEMTALLEARDEQITAMKTSVANQDVSKEDTAETWREIQTQFDTGLSGVLTTWQLETYRERQGVK